MSKVLCLTGIDWQAVSAITSAIAVAFALFLPFLSEHLRRRPKRTDLKFKDTVIHLQGNDSIGRLVIKNHSDNVAVSVEAYVESITEKGVLRDGFLPVPLYWTHINPTRDNSTRRNIHGNQTVYLDVFRFKPPVTLLLQTPIVGHGTENFNELYYTMETDLEISIYQESGQVVTKKAKINYNGSTYRPTMSING